MIFKKGDLIEMALDLKGKSIIYTDIPCAGDLGFIEATSFGSNSLKRNWYFVRMSNGTSEVLKDEWMLKVEGK
jgi:hypothetical protein|tara:strand:- start:316 stop:534 length:219 start_codon:yes stop_codon:yes gene_type:complete